MCYMRVAGHKCATYELQVTNVLQSNYFTLHSCVCTNLANSRSNSLMTRCKVAQVLSVKTLAEPFLGPREGSPCAIPEHNIITK